MEHLIEANYIADLKNAGGQDKLLTFTGNAGDRIYIGSSPKRCQTHFEVLCGLRKPDVGEVKLAGTDPYALSPREGAAFRRDTVGAIPLGGGLIPELRMIDQIAMPMQLAGYENSVILEKIRSLTSELLPLHSLYNTPGRCTVRKQAHAAILRAIINKPKVLVLNSFLDDMTDLDTGVLWQVLLGLCPENCVLVYLSGAPAPEQISWTRELRI